MVFLESEQPVLHLSGQQLRVFGVGRRLREAVIEQVQKAISCELLAYFISSKVAALTLANNSCVDAQACPLLGMRLPVAMAFASQCIALHSENF